MKALRQKWKAKLIFRGAHRLSGTGIVECLEMIDVGCNLKQFDGLTWLTLAAPCFTTDLRHCVPVTRFIEIRAQLWAVLFCSPTQTQTYTVHCIDQPLSRIANNQAGLFACCSVKTMLAQNRYTFESSSNVQCENQVFVQTRPTVRATSSSLSPYNKRYVSVAFGLNHCNIVTI